MPILVFALVLFHYLISALYGLSHLVVDVQLHIVYCHLNNVVRLINFLQFLFGLVAKNFNFRLSTLLRLFEFIIKSALSFSE